MSHWETAGQSDEWYTPGYIFNFMNARFDLDVAAPVKRFKDAPMDSRTFVPCDRVITSSLDGLKVPWQGFVWMNPPFGGRNGIKPWLDKFFAHGNGVALTPDRTSAPWWQDAARKADAVLFIAGKVKFIRPDGSLGKSPSNGTTLFAAGSRGVQALFNAQDAGLGWMAVDA